MKRLKWILPVFATLLLMPAVQAATPACHMHGMKQGVTPPATVKTDLSVKLFTQVTTLFNLPTFLTTSAKQEGGGPQAKNNSCPVMAWEAWRERHPNSPSRYTKKIGRASGGLAIALSLAPSPEPEPEDDPEPDPGFGQCGCDPATALAANGCGWIHANIWH